MVYCRELPACREARSAAHATVPLASGPCQSLPPPTCDTVFCFLVESLKVSEGLMEALDHNSDLEKIHARCVLPLVVC